MVIECLLLFCYIYLAFLVFVATWGHSHSHAHLVESILRTESPILLWFHSSFSFVGQGRQDEGEVQGHQTEGDEADRVLMTEGNQVSTYMMLTNIGQFVISFYLYMTVCMCT